MRTYALVIANLALAIVKCALVIANLALAIVKHALVIANLALAIVKHALVIVELAKMECIKGVKKNPSLNRDFFEK
ncbi:MAG: hypothetical protein WAU11_04525 [Ignavibacteriaceae bacterium]